MLSYYKIVGPSETEFHFCISLNQREHIAIPENIEKVANQTGTYRVFRNVFVDSDPRLPNKPIEWHYTGYMFHKC